MKKPEKYTTEELTAIVHFVSDLANEHLARIKRKTIKFDDLKKISKPYFDELMKRVVE